MPNTIGQFKTADNPYGDVAMDLLYIELVNPFVALGGNPVGFDNVVVSMVGAVPEPATSGLLLIVAAGIFSLRLCGRRLERGLPSRVSHRAASRPRSCSGVCFRH